MIHKGMAMTKSRETKEYSPKPLSASQKKIICDQLKKIPDKNLLLAITEAALKGIHFPKPIADELIHLQHIHIKHAADPKMGQHTKPLIEIFIDKNFYQ